jgi:RNA polymerase sigma factor for flagellar operon FliA
MREVVGLNARVRRPAPADALPLWQRWMACRSPDGREELVRYYTAFTRILAARCYTHRASQELEFDDYLQFGMVGLLESIDRFDPDVGVKFETFAAHRICGAILNGVESLSEVQRQTATRRRVVRERVESISENRDEEAPPSALERLAEVAIGLALGFALEHTGLYCDGREDVLPDNAYSRVEMRQFRERLAACVQSLAEQQRTVIHRHYFQQMPFDQIAETMKLTKGRISQIHRAAVERLRELQHQHALFATTL